MIRPIPAAALLAMCAASFAAPAAFHAGGDDVDELIAAIESARDEVEPDLIVRLAGQRSRKAADALISVYGRMGSIYMRREIVKALALFDGVAEAEQQALQRIMDVATDSQEPELREAALEALGRCEHLGKSLLEAIVDSAAEDDVREHAMRLHVARAVEADQAWYRKLYEKEKGRQKEKKADRKRREREREGEGPELLVYELKSVREMAFRAIQSSLKDEEVLEASEDSWRGVRGLALEEYHRRDPKKALRRAQEVFEDIDGDPGNRAVAARIMIAERGARAADTFIEYCGKFITPQALRYDLADLMAELGDAKIEARLSKLVGKGKEPYEKLWVLRALRKAQDPKLRKPLEKLLADKDDSVRIAAARVIGGRGELESLPALQKLIDKTESAEVIAAAVGAMSALRGTDPEWEGELLAYTGHEHSDVRNAALQQLGKDGRTEHMDVLAQALDHPSWSTRYAALLGLAHMRVKAVVPLIIARMPQETGRMLHEFADVLFDLTGQPFRTAVGNWKAWWQRDGAAFEVITAAELARRVAEEDERRLKQITNVKFFGIRIVSQRVVFVIDVSGSMNESLRAKYAGESGLTTRIDVAKRELQKCIDGLDSGALFNVITFAGDVSSWLDEGVTGSTSKSRDEARQWVERLGAGGATNLYDALRKAFDDPDVDTIFVLSDGEPTAGVETDQGVIREHVARWNEHRGIVINTISVGLDLPVLKWLAEDSSGKHMEFR